MKKLMSFVLMLIVAFTLVGCQRDVLPTSIALNTEGDKTTIAVGETLTITAVITPDNATDKTVEWSSSNTNVATVNGGVVTGRNAGTTTITARANAADGVTQTITITVTAGSVTGVTIRGEAEVNEGATTRLTANLTPTGAQGEVVWSSSNTDVATVDQTGTVTGVAAGTATITAAVGTVTDEFTITVNAVAEELTSLTISGKLFVLVGEALQFTVRSNLDEEPIVTWASSNGLVASVSSTGLVTGLMVGTTTISAVSGTVTGYYRITVVAEEIEAQSMVIEGEASVVREKTSTYTIAYTPEDSTNVGVTWAIKAGGEQFATIDEEGTLRALQNGSVTIVATMIENPEIVAEYEVAITDPIEAESFIIRTSSGNNSVTIGTSLTLQLVFTPENTTEKGVTWTIDDPTIATVNEFGTINGIKPGTVTVTAVMIEQPDISSTITLEINEVQVINPESITVTGPEEMYVGNTVYLSATVYPNGTNQNVTWEVQARTAEYASIDATTGRVTALKAGTARFRATSTVDSKAASGWFTIVIENAPEKPPYVDMNGYKIVVMVASSELPTLDPRHPDNKSFNAAARKEAFEASEKASNCVIEVTAFPDAAPWGPTRIQWLNSNAALNQSECDVCIISSGWLRDFVQGRALVDVTTFYQKYGRREIESAYRTALSFGQSLYGITEGVSEVSNNVTLGLYYNYGMLKRYNIESPAKLFNEGRWTYSGALAWAQSAQAVLSPDGISVFTGHPYYWWTGLSNAAGIALADVIRMDVNVMSEKSQAAASFAQTLFNSGVMDDTVSWAETNGTFLEQKALTTTGFYWFIEGASRWSRDQFGEGTTEFGYVPFPYPDNMTKDQTRVAVDGYSAFVMPSGREFNHTGNVTYETIYRAMVEAFLDANVILQSDSSYDPDSLLDSLLSSKLDDSESITAARYFDASKVIYDPVHGMYTSISGTPLATPSQNVILQNADFITEFEAVFSGYKQDFLSHFAG